jgi:hypothetical protein
MLTKKQIAIMTILLVASGVYVSTLEVTSKPYECYFWKLSQEKDIIICNYPGTTDMYHSYLKEKDLQTSMISEGATYTYSGKHPSGLNYTAYQKQNVIKP